MPKRQTSDDAETWDGLAGLLDIPTRRLHEYRKRDGAPESKSVSEWEEWVSEHAVPSAADAAEPSAIDLLIKTETHRKLKIKNDRDEGTLIDEAQQAAREILVSEGKRLRSILVGLVPSRLAKACAGKSGSEIEVAARTIVEAALLEAKREPK